MKTMSLLIAAAAGLTFAATGAHASDRVVDAYLQGASAAASAKVAAAGVVLPAEGLTVRGHLGGDGRLSGVQVVRSTGSLETDLRATQALRRVSVGDPPPGLIGAQLKIAVGPSAIVQAKAHQDATP